MVERTPWFERVFEVGLPPDAMPSLLERLRGTPARIADRLTALPQQMLTRRHDDSWSIQENVGHLLDLEELWSRRVDDFVAGRPELAPADLQNKKTHQANHNQTDLFQLVAGFRLAREHLVPKLESLGEEQLRAQAQHPRLRQPMTIPDLCHFVAEHDDHHLARVSELIRIFGES